KKVEKTELNKGAEPAGGGEERSVEREGHQNLLETAAIVRLTPGWMENLAAWNQLISLDHTDAEPAAECPTSAEFLTVRSCLWKTKKKTTFVHYYYYYYSYYHYHYNYYYHRYNYSYYYYYYYYHHHYYYYYYYS
ncbi:hypothetical protein AMECASPLE_026209, partial [Ameca splendens]